MKLRLVPASQGLHWVRQGLRITRMQPLGFIGLLGMVLASALLLAGLPVVGPLIVVAAMPTIWMGFMLATRRVILGERAMPSVLIEALRGPEAPRAALLQLGGAYVLATLAVMTLAQWLGPGSDALGEAMDASKDAGEVLSDPLVLQDMLWRMGLSLPVSLLFWHTPALVLWGRLSVGKALFFSAVASWRNLGAFTVYGLGWAGILLALGLLDRLIHSVLGVPALTNMLAVVIGMAVAAAFYASLYFTVVDCFEAPKQPGSDDDPVA